MSAVQLLGGLREGIDAVGLRRLDAGAADRAIQEAAGREGRVADDFGVETHSLLPGEQQIAGILVFQIGAKLGRLAVGVAGDDEAVHFFERPAAADELGGEPVEQLGMRGEGALRAEIFLGFDEAAAEIVHPDAVHLDARRERVFGMDEPAGEVEAGARVLVRFGGVRADNLGGTASRTSGVRRPTSLSGRKKSPRR